MAPAEERQEFVEFLGALSVEELLGHPALADAELIAGAEGTARLVRRLNVMSVPDIVGWTKEDEFLLATGYPLPRAGGEFDELIGRLNARGVAGLGVKLDQYLAKIPNSVIATADELSFPVVLIPRSSAFDDILSQAFATIVNRQTAALTVAREIHDAFLAVALAGGGLTKLAEELATILRGAMVVIADPDGRVLAATGEREDIAAAGFCADDGSLITSRLRPGVHQAHHRSRRHAVALIQAGDLWHGFVVAIEGPEVLPAFVLTAVDQAALVAALEITRDLAVSAVQRQFASNALHDLVTSSPSAIADVVARAATFGWDLDRPLSVLVGRREDEVDIDGRGTRQLDLATVRTIALWTSAIRARDRQAAVAGFATELVAVVGASLHPEDLARSVQAEMTSLTGGTYAVGVSRVEDTPEAVPRAYQDARVALSVGRRVKGAGAVTGYGDLGLFRLINKVSESDLRSFVDDTLGAVLALAPPTRDDLIRTLTVLLENHLNVAESSRILHYHYNTLRYRIGKLERLLGPFTTNPQEALKLSVALQILGINEIFGGTSASAGPYRN